MVPTEAVGRILEAGQDANTEILVDWGGVQDYARTHRGGQPCRRAPTMSRSSGVYWICRSCGARVPIEILACPTCEQPPQREHAAEPEPLSHQFPVPAERKGAATAPDRFSRYCCQCGAQISDSARHCSNCGEALPAPSTLAASAVPSGRTVRFAGFWYRTLAYLIDSLIGGVGLFFAIQALAVALGLSVAGNVTHQGAGAAGAALGSLLGFMLGLLSSSLYYTILESSKWQATIGKRLLGLRVTDEAGARIGFGRANGRYWSKTLSALILGVGFLMVGFTTKKQGLHDMIAGTLVLRGHA